MSDCIFCKIIEKSLPSDIVYEDDDMIAIKDLYPKADVHLLVLPKKHIESLNKLNDDDAHLAGKMLAKIKHIAQAAGIGDGFITKIHTEAKGGQEIFHLHYHILSP